MSKGFWKAIGIISLLNLMSAGPLAAAPLPTVSIDPQSLLFGKILVGQASSPLTASVRKDSPPFGLQIERIVLGNPLNFKILSEDCTGAVLESGVSCQITADFHPDQFGNYASAISIVDSTGNVANFIPLEAKGLNTLATPAPIPTPAPGIPNVVLTANKLDFGSQNIGATAEAQTITLSNTGTSTLTVKAITLGGDAQYNFSKIDTCSLAPIPPSGTCTITAIFTPAIGGDLQAALAVVDNAEDSPQIILLSGFGLGGTTPISGGGCSLTAKPLAFPSGFFWMSCVLALGVPIVFQNLHSNLSDNLRVSSAAKKTR